MLAAAGIIGLVTSVSVAAPAMAQPTSAPAKVKIKTVSTDPYTNVSAYHQTEVESDTYAWGDTVVGVFQTGRFSNGGSDNTGFATSTDGGKTWTHGFLPSTTSYADPPGPYARLSDPSVAYDPKHDVWLANSLTVDTKNTDIVNRSTDGGLTWGPPVIISAPTGSSDYDKTWVACDTFAASPHYGNCYAEVDDYPAGDIVKMFTSTDGGKTWSAATVATSHGLGGQPLAGPDGTVIVPFWSDSNQIQSVVSHDGGKTFQGPYTAATITDHEVEYMRVEPLPTAEIDSTGRVYVMWQDCRFRTACATNDIVMTTSKNGQHWTNVVRVPIDGVGSTVDHFNPGLGVDHAHGRAHARLALSYYYFPNADCTLDTCKLDAGYVSSRDGGKHWTTPKQVLGPMSLHGLPNAGGLFIGDYLSTAIAGKRAYSVMPNATSDSCVLGDITSCKEAMVAVRGGLRVRAGTTPAGADQALPGGEIGPHAQVWPQHRRIF